MPGVALESKVSRNDPIPVMVHHAPVTPTATYRIQFTPKFRFADAKRVLPYLQDLGVSHIHASPITRARHGSADGYDLCDPRTVNLELGTHQELMDLLTAVRSAGMGWVQDVVANHMAASQENPYWQDTLLHGQGSKWAAIFDIDWNHPDMDGRIQLPVLAEPYGACLRHGKLSVIAGPSGPLIAYREMRFPVTPASLPGLLAGQPCCWALARSAAAAGTNADPDDRERELGDIWEQLNRSPIRAAYDEACKAVQGDRLDRLLQEQPWRLAWWRTSREMTSYRRLLAADDLIAVRIDDPAAFDLMYSMVIDLADLELIQVIRVDHIDALRDPERHLRRLHERLPRVNILVEKILAGGEQLPVSWPVGGTTGHDFLTGVMAASCHPETSDRFCKIHRRIIGPSEDGERLRIRLRADFARLGLAGDADHVVRLVRAAHLDEPDVRDLAPGSLRAAVAAITARLPVYRTYGRVEDRSTLCEARDRALADLPALAPAITAVHRVFEHGLDPASPPSVREALLRFQQFSGPVMAKGSEDAFSHAFTRWVCLNEVGGDPLSPAPTPVGFIMSTAARAIRWPMSLNATTTHATKRGEDTRARLVALTWLPELWEHFADSVIHRVSNTPFADDKYAILQAVVATWPSDGRITPDYVEGLRRYARKSLRMAGLRSSSSDPEEGYEESATSWLTTLCDPVRSVDFHRAIATLVARLLPAADAVSLAMIVLKCTLPGIPDIYQGCEWPDHSLVDSADRLPVDFAARAKGLKSGTDLPPIGHAYRKQLVLRRCLAARRSDPAFWRDAPTKPWRVTGEEDGIFAFSRGRGAQSAIVMADVRSQPRKASAALPALPDGMCWCDVLSGRMFAPEQRFSVAALLQTLSCAVLVPSDRGPAAKSS